MQIILYGQLGPNLDKLIIIDYEKAEPIPFVQRLLIGPDKIQMERVLYNDKTKTFEKDGEGNVNSEIVDVVVLESIISPGLDYRLGPVTQKMVADCPHKYLKCVLGRVLDREATGKPK